jgi:N-acetylglucosaminyldiphosphoundecaprenol N-acetyl-beta-D-mannosaminyltransferase
LGVPISVTTLESANRAIQSWAADEQGRYVFVRDVHGVMQAQNDRELMELHHTAALVTPDGMPLVWLGKLAGLPVERTCGADLMAYVLAASERTGLRHYFYGGKPGVADALKAAARRRFPLAQIVGVGTPPFRPLTEIELQEVAQSINASRADVVWLGISTPKQEFLMRDLTRHTRATLIGVGAAFDFHAGLVRRAPAWIQRAGLEWSWRLISEPRRLWRRYLTIVPAFLWRVATTWASRG